MFLLKDVFSNALMRPPRQLRMVGKGNWRVVYGYNEKMVIKLADAPHGNEALMSTLFPSITAEVVWQGKVHVAMQAGPATELVTFYGLVQKRSELAVERFKSMGKEQIKEFLFYVGAVLTWVESKNVSICDVGPSNLAVNPAYADPPRLLLVDTQDWYQAGAQRKKGFSGMLRLAYSVCPEDLAPAYHHVLRQQGCAIHNGELATTFNRDTNEASPGAVDATPR
ncbi:unnamed protein product, partial [Symbiodinium sp. CCMP2456]